MGKRARADNFLPLFTLPYDPPPTLSLFPLRVLVLLVLVVVVVIMLAVDCSADFSHDCMNEKYCIIDVGLCAFAPGC